MNSVLKKSLGLVLLTLSLSTGAQTVAPFQKGDRVAFVGNSITDGGHYHSYIWLYYMTHFPTMRLWMANCGVGGDTAEMILARLDDDVLSKKPNVMTFTFGMNDTGYYEYNGDDAEAFGNRKVNEARTAFLNCEKRLKELTHVRKIMIGTSPYDQTSTFNNDIFKNKNDYMQRVIAIQDSAAKVNGWEFLDFNKPMLQINKEQQALDPAYTIISSDRIHPDNDGHMAMAYIFLKAQGMVGKKVADVVINAQSGKVEKKENCRISGLKKNAEGISFTYLAQSLPLPLDTIPRGWGFTHSASQVERAIPSFMNDLSDEHLTIRELQGQYEMKIDEVIIDTLSASNLAQGINMANYRHTPQYQQACAIMALNEARWELERRYREWAWVNYSFMLPAGYVNNFTEEGARKYRELCAHNDWLLSKRGTYDSYIHPEVQKVFTEEMDFLVDRIYQLNRPQKHRITLQKL